MTATATPDSVAWSTGDGEIVTCAGPGSPYRPDIPADAASPDCGHTFRRVSGVDGFTVTVTVRWSVSWAGAGQAGVFAGLESTASAVVMVRDAPAVNVLPGGG